MPQNPDPLSEPYHRAHRGYGLVTGVLLLWELVGAEMDVIPVLNVTLTTADAIPHVLAVLLGYYAVRVSLEWCQCDVRRRVTVPARIDFVFAHGLGGLALVVYFFRQFLNLSPGAHIDVNSVMAALLGFLVTLGGCEIYRYRREGQTDTLRLVTFYALTLVPVAILGLQIAASRDIVSSLVGLLPGAALAFGTWHLLRRSTR